MSADLFGSGTGRRRDVYTVARLNREAKLLLESGLPPLWVEGELSNLSRPSSGHWYFSLKDEHAQVRCAMFRAANLRARVVPRDGLHVLLHARVSLYEARGDFQLVVEQLEEAGEGLLRRRFEALKARLAAEGLFDAARKRPLPRLPRRIGVMTSPTGAAIRDVLHVLRRRFPAIPVLIYPVPVQGAAAAADIAAALTAARVAMEVDVLILARGGGSLEDLWAFNEEVVARAVRACPVPVVAGIGHEIDVTIADLAADLRAPTPSGAAELVAPDRGEWQRALSAGLARLAPAARRRLRAARETLHFRRHRLLQAHPGRRLRERSQRLDELEGRSARAIARRVEAARDLWVERRAALLRASPAAALARFQEHIGRLSSRLAGRVRERLARQRTRLEVSARALGAVSPLATLERGYAIVTRADGRIVREVASLALGEQVRTRTAHGAFESLVSALLRED